MARLRGSNAWIGIGQESTLGTLATRTDWLEITSESLSYKRPTKYEETLRTRSMEQYLDGEASVSGGFDFLFGYQGYERLIYNALGAKAVTGPNADGMYTHTFSLAETLPTGLSIQANRDATNAGNAFNYSGCLIKSLKISSTIGGFIKGAVEVEGIDEALGAVDTPTFPTFKGAKWSDLITMTLGGTTYKPKSIEFTIENPLADKIYILGKLTRDDLFAVGARSITGSLEVDIDSLTLYTMAKNKTPFALVSKWQGPLIAGASNYSLTINAPNCIAEIETPNVKNAGPISMKFPFRAIVNTTPGDECTIVCTNTRTSVP